MGLRRSFLPHVLRVGFVLPSCQLSLYICICRRNAEFKSQDRISLLAFVSDLGVVTRFLIYSLAYISMQFINSYT